MSTDFDDFRRTRLWRHPTTWIVAIWAAVHGGWTMAIRAPVGRASRGVEGSTSPWVDTLTDVAAGGAFELAIYGCAIYMVAGMLEHANQWLRQGTLFGVYALIFLLRQYL